MKKNFRIAAIAIATVAFMAACNNNNAAEEVILDTTPVVDTTIVEEAEVVVEEEVEAPAAKPAAKAKKTVKQEVKEVEEGVKTVGIKTKKDVQTVTNELKRNESNTVSTTNVGKVADPLGANKKPASEQTFVKQ